MPCANPILNLSKSCLWPIKTDGSASLRYAVSHAGVKNGLPINISESEEILKLMVFQCIESYTHIGFLQCQQTPLAGVMLHQHA